jgi:succinoglycan biosynthesis transport protein ExoP
VELTAWEQWPSPLGESFRLTMTSILFAENGNRSPAVIAFSSAKPGEGKTTVISNLAISLARIGRRVLLIDGDMRKPRLHEIFRVAHSPGLSDALQHGDTPAIRSTGITNLSLLPRGEVVDEKVFFSSRLEPLLANLKSYFDMILIDTAPLLLMTDARLLSHYAEAVILVVAQHTDRDAVADARQRLADDGTPILGTILNRWDPRDSLRSTWQTDSREYYERYAKSLSRNNCDNSSGR